MNALSITKHADTRMAQRGISPKDAELIALIGTEVSDGYLLRNRDYQEIERALKELAQRVRRLVGKRIVVANGRIVTAYHPSKKYKRGLLRVARQGGLADD